MLESMVLEAVFVSMSILGCQPLAHSKELLLCHCWSQTCNELDINDAGYSSVLHTKVQCHTLL